MAFGPVSLRVVIRFQICIFDILNTAQVVNTKFSI